MRDSEALRAFLYASEFSRSSGLKNGIKLGQFTFLSVCRHVVAARQILSAGYGESSGSNSPRPGLGSRRVGPRLWRKPSRSMSATKGRVAINPALFVSSAPAAAGLAPQPRSEPLVVTIRSRTPGLTASARRIGKTGLDDRRWPR